MHFTYRFLLFALSFFALCCAKQDPMEQKENLKGYWEITEVKLPNGVKKDFSISTTVDFINIKGDLGTRIKVSPNLDGTFSTNNFVEEFTLKIEEDSLRLHYKTPFDSWKETVVMAKDSILKMKVSDGKIYTYKKFTKFNFNLE